MAFIYIRGNFFWIRRQGISGEVVRESLGIPVDSEGGRLRARKKAAHWTAKELGGMGPKERRHWGAWVPEYLKTRYSKKSPLSLDRANAAWEKISLFLTEQEILFASALTYRTAGLYVDWRITGGKDRKAVNRNTAVTEFVFFRVVTKEALRREYSDIDPCRQIEVSMGPKKVKREITLDDQAKIEAALSDGPEWMREHWLVLMRQGIRCREAAVPLDRIDEKNGTIMFRLKGGRDFVAPLHKDLLPLVAKAREENRPVLVPNMLHAPKYWYMLFHRLGMPYSVHCTRVTVITRLLRAKHTIADVCGYIGHTAEVNVIYRRINHNDVRSLGDALS